MSLKTSEKQVAGSPKVTLGKVTVAELHVSMTSAKKFIGENLTVGLYYNSWLWIFGFWNAVVSGFSCSKSGQDPRGARPGPQKR